MRAMATRPRRTLALHSPVTQRTVRFLVGLGLLIYEAVIYQGETRWPLLVVYGGMMGLPFAEKADDLRRLAMSGREEEGGP